MNKLIEVSVDVLDPDGKLFGPNYNIMTNELMIEVPEGRWPESTVAPQLLEGLDRGFKRNANVSFTLHIINTVFMKFPTSCREVIFVPWGKESLCMIVGTEESEGGPTIEDFNLSEIRIPENATRRFLMLRLVYIESYQTLVISFPDEKLQAVFKVAVQKYMPDTQITENA